MDGKQRTILMTPAQPSHPDSSASTTVSYRSLPRGIWALGFGSLFMHMSSELVHSLLPVFMATTLGVSMVTIGIFEGFAEAAAGSPRCFRE